MTNGYTPPWPDAEGWPSFEWSVPETYNIGTAALEGADPGATALYHVDRRDESTAFTYRELDRAADAVAAALREGGVEAGDRIGVCLPQCPEALLTHLAAFRLGAVVVPLSMVLGRESFAYSIEHAGCSALVIDRQRREELDGEPASVPTAIPVETGANGYDGAAGRLGGFAGRVDPDGSVEPATTAPNDPALILYTSGTTGDPKGVVQGHRYLIGSLPGYQCWFQLFDPASAAAARVWTPSEWAWAGALFDVVFPTLALGGTVVSRERRSGFEADRALALIEEGSVTHAFLPPTALARIRDEGAVEEFDVSELAVLQCGGEKLSPALLEWGEDALGATINEAYGQTEANALAGNCQRWYPARQGSMGRPYPGHELSILDDEGEPLPPGEVGELAVKTPDPVVFLEYRDDPEATADRYSGDWLLTGDAAERDADGYLRHRGRMDDLIITSGYRVSPLEVESALEAAESVVAAAVGGVPDEQRGERVKAYVVLAEESEPSTGQERRLRERVRETAGAHKVPREIEFVDRLPETRSGKVDRAALFD